MSIAHAQHALRDGKVSSVQLVQRCLENADTHADVGVFTTRFDEQALQAAERADDERAAGSVRGGLHGIPIGIKDIVRTVEGPTSAQSVAMDPKWGQVRRDATVVSRLRDAGALIVGKTTTSEFAMGMPDPRMPFPIPRNPWDLRRYAGGSSSGSASGLVTGAFLGSVGTDTGGSIRIPAAFCGITGLKTAYGQLPVDGVFPLAFSLDTIGPMARTAADCRLLLDVMSGQSVGQRHRPHDDVAPAADLSDVRIGVERANHLLDPRATAAVVAATDAAVNVLIGAGARSREVQIPRFAELEAASMLICMAEAAAVHVVNMRRRWERYGESLKSGLLAGLATTAVEYLQAKRACARAHRELDAVFADVDVVVLPTVLRGAIPVDAPLSELIESIKVTAWNGLGYPVLSVPAGLDDDGLPLGLSIVGRPGDEALMLRVAEVYQTLTDWHQRTPGGTND